jgi:osmotically inducible protein OsmC
MLRKASAVWKGSLKEGQGTVSVPSGALKDLSYNFGQRFEDKPGTNPEELIVAAHASCFAMALSAALGKDNLTPDSIDSKGTLTFEKTDAGFTITRIHLEVVGKVPGASNEAFQKAADDAKRTCPISRVLKAEITLDAKLA